MRTLRVEVAGLPAGTKYDVYLAPGRSRRIVYETPEQWVGDSLRGRYRMGARIDGPGTLARLTAAWPLYDWHVRELGCNPEEPVPCGFCGEKIPACLTRCPECGEDPDGANL